MYNNWTYGQYAIYRILFGIYLIVHFICLLPWCAELFSNKGMLPSGSLSPLYYIFPNILLINDSPIIIYILLTFGILGGVLFLIGKKDRYAAILCWYVLTCLFDRNPLIANPSLPYVGWLLLAHACLPTYDKKLHNWRMSEGIFLAAWMAMAIGYSYSGYVKLMSPSWLDGSALKHVLHNPLANSNFITELLLSLPDFGIKLLTWSALILELSFAPLSIFARARPWLWLMMLSMHMSLLLIIRFPDLSFGMIMLHLFTFNPAWMKPKQMKNSLLIFYDGSCGFCHSFVRFTLSENIDKTAFVFKPLQGKSFQELTRVNQITFVPDSIVVYDSEKKVMIYKFKAITRIFEGLGGVWRCIAYLLKIIPSKICDIGYDLFAIVRHKIYKKPNATCPLLPQEWKQFILID